jgi:hypothetical protein
MQRTAASEATLSDITATSFKSSPISTEIGDMNVNLGTKRTFDPAMAQERMLSSGDPALVSKAIEMQKGQADLAQTKEATRKEQMANDMQLQVGNLNAMATMVDMARADPEAAVKYANKYEAQYPDMGKTLAIEQVGNDRFQIQGIDNKGQNYTQVINGTQLTEARTDANVRWQQYNENLRQQERLAQERKLKDKDKAGPDYIDVVAPDTGQAGRMKTTDLENLWKQTHPKEASNDLEYATAEMMAHLPGATEDAKNRFEVLKAAKSTAYHNYIAWAWNTYQADPSGLLKSKRPIQWMGTEEPPAQLMRGKARFDHDKNAWLISNGSEWVAPTEAQMKQINKQVQK